PATASRRNSCPGTPQGLVVHGRDCRIARGLEIVGAARGSCHVRKEGGTTDMADDAIKVLINDVMEKSGGGVQGADYFTLVVCGTRHKPNDAEHEQLSRVLKEQFKARSASQVSYPVGEKMVQAWRAEVLRRRGGTTDGSGT